MPWLNQVVQITLINLKNIPQRLGTSLVVVVGIAGVVGVLVSVLAMGEGFRHTLASTGRPTRVIMLRAGSDAEMSSGVARDQATVLGNLPGIARDGGGRPLVSAELFVMVDLPRHGQTEDRKSTRLNSSHVEISYAVFCLKKKINQAKNSISLNCH